MPQLINCPQCQRQLRVPDDLVGKEVKCPSCAANFRVEASASPPPTPAAPEVAIREASQPQPAAAAPPPVAAYDDDDEPRVSRWVKEDINNVAVGLIIVGIVNVGLSICGLGLNVFTTGMGAAMGPQPGANDPDFAINMFSGALGIVQGIVNLLLGGLIIYGGLKMKRLESYGLAMTSAVLTVIPCTTCCLWGLPVGIWALVVLSKPEVKAAFETH